MIPPRRDSRPLFYDPRGYVVRVLQPAVRHLDDVVMQPPPYDPNGSAPSLSTARY